MLAAASEAQAGGASSPRPAEAAPAALWVPRPPADAPPSRTPGVGPNLSLATMTKLKRASFKAQIVSGLSSPVSRVPLHLFKDHVNYTGRDKLKKSDRMRQLRMLESVHGHFGAMLEDVEFLHRCFTLLDGDDDGRLTAEELKRWLAVLNDGEPTNEELKDALDMMPGKGGVEVDGEVMLADPEMGVEFEDFLGIMQDYYTGLGAAHLRLIYVDMLVLEPGDEGALAQDEIEAAEAERAAALMPKVILPPRLIPPESEGAEDWGNRDVNSCACAIM